MTSLIVALLISFAIVTYWVMCRRRALKYQVKAVELLEEYCADKSVSQQDKDSLYNDYLISRKWYSLPVFSVVTPFLLAYMLIKEGKLDVGGKTRGNHKLYMAAFDQQMKMMISKNPIVSIICLAIIGISFALAITIGVVLNRLSVLPTPRGIALLFSKVSDLARKKAHLH